MRIGLSGPKICEKEHDSEALAMQGEFQHLQFLAMLAVMAILAIWGVRSLP
jgi:hypothetical protein